MYLWYILFIRGIFPLVLEFIGSLAGVPYFYEQKFILQWAYIYALMENHSYFYLCESSSLVDGPYNF